MSAFGTQGLASTQSFPLLVLQGLSIPLTGAGTTFEYFFCFPYVRTAVDSFILPVRCTYIFYTGTSYVITKKILHRFLWQQKVAKKVKVCKLFSQLSSCTLFMGAKSCEKSLETFTFDNNRATWSKSLQTFCVANVAEESCTAEIIPVRGPAKT